MRQAAQEAGITYSSVVNQAVTGGIPSKKVGNKRLVDPDYIYKVIEDNIEMREGLQRLYYEASEKMPPYRLIQWCKKNIPDVGNMDQLWYLNIWKQLEGINWKYQEQNMWRLWCHRDKIKKMIEEYEG